MTGGHLCEIPSKKKRRSPPLVLSLIGSRDCCHKEIPTSRFHMFNVERICWCFSFFSHPSRRTVALMDCTRSETSTPVLSCSASSPMVQRLLLHRERGDVEA